MTWLTWRQFRATAYTTVAVLVVIATVYGFSGLQLHDLAAANGYPGCLTVGRCHAFLAIVTASELYPRLYNAAIIVLYLAPAVIGLFWGAPLLARDLETNSHRLLWTQSVSRTRWLATKLILVATAATATVGMLSAIVTWWCEPIDSAGGLGQSGYRFDLVPFGARGIAPVGYTLFALLLGACSGVLLRRTLPAMALTLAVFIALQVAVPQLLRSHYQPAVAATIAVTSPQSNIRIVGTEMVVESQSRPLGAWVLADDDVDAAGNIVVLRATDACLQGTDPGSCERSVLAMHISERLLYQPADRFWTFQVYETLLYLAAALALVLLVVWRVRTIS